MSQSNNNIQIPPTISQVELDQVIGRKIFGPFKRVVSGQVNETKECVRVSELLIRDFIHDPEVEPSEVDVKNWISFYNRMKRLLNLMKAIPKDVEDKKNLPAVLASSRREQFATEVQALLVQEEYESTLKALSDTMGKYELLFTTEGIEMETVQPKNTNPAEVDNEPVMGGDESKKGSETSSPKTYNSTHEKFSFDEVDDFNGSIDTAYKRELEAKAAALATDSILREKGQAKGIPTVPSGRNSVLSGENTIREQVIPPERFPNLKEPTGTPKNSPANSIRSAPINVQEPNPQFPFHQPKVDEQLTPEMVQDILYNIERIQAEKDRENKRVQQQMLKQIAALRKESYSGKPKREKVEKTETDFEEAEEPHRVPKQEKRRGSPKAEIKPEPKKIIFTSSSESDEDEEVSYDEQTTSQSENESEHRYTSGHDEQYHRRYNLKKKVTQSRVYPTKTVKLDDVRKNLISFNGTGRFEAFKTIFLDEVMENPHIKPFMKASLLEQHLKGKASEYMYELEDPLESIRMTFQDLQKAFGGKTDKMTLLEKFNNLPFSKGDCEKMVADIAAHRKVMAQLAEKKVDINDIRSITTFTKKLPTSISEKVVKYLAKAKDGKVHFYRVLEIVEEQIRVLRTAKSVYGEKKIQGSNELSNPQEIAVHYINPNSHQNQHQPQQRGGNRPQGIPKSQENSGHNGKSYNGNQQPYRPSGRVTTPQPGQKLYDQGNLPPRWSMVAYSFPFPVPEQGKSCVACDGPHKPVRCPLTSTEFRKKLQERNLCERCTLSGHKTDQCPGWYRCAYCQGDHAMGGCPLKEFYRKRENIPKFCVIKDASPQKRSFFRKNGKTHSQ